MTALATKAGRSGLFAGRSGRSDLLVFAALCALTVILLFPIFLVVSTSFKQPGDVASTTFRLFFTPTLDNYLALVGLRPSEFQFDLWLHFRNSAAAAAGSTALAVILGTPAAYAFARVAFPGAKSGMLLLLGMRLLPPMASVIPLFLLMRQVGLLDSVWGLILAYTSFNLPFFIWMMYSFFLDLPRELEEAALIDGASRWQAFWKVILPLCRPGLAAAAIFCVVLSWNDFLFAVTLTGRNAPTLPLLVSGFITDMGTAWGIIMAAGSVIVIPTIIFTFFTQKNLVKGLTAGAVKD